MTNQTIGALRSARTAPALVGAYRPRAHARNRPISNIPVEELRRLVADMVD
jgi:hypothetical protein